MPAAERRRLVQAALVLAAVCGVALLGGLAAGSDGWSWPAGLAGDPVLRAIVFDIRLPRTLGAWLVGALLGLAGAIAQGLFRNPLADPYLLGTAAGASLAVVAVLAAAAALGEGSALAPGAVVADMAGRSSVAGLSGSAAAGYGLQALADLGIAASAFCGAALGMVLTLTLARGARHTARLLLAGVVVGVLLMALSDLLTTAYPQALRARQGFLLGSTGYVGWGGVALLAAGLALTLPWACRLARVLDALALGEDAARSLGLDLGRLRVALIGLLALATGLAVSQAGLIAFVGLVAPHIVRRSVTASHRVLLAASAATGGALLLGADLLARTVVSPQELPVGVLTAVLGGSYLLWLLQRSADRS
jgi:iron complex transport system permease protein